MGAGLKRAVQAARATRAKRTLGLKIRDWKGADLRGTWYVTYKIDGVCVIVTERGDAISRAGKPLYNVPTDDVTDGLTPGIYECYLGSWEKSVSAVRSQFDESGKAPAPMVAPDAFYALAWLNGTRRADTRLNAGMMINPVAATISARLDDALAKGYEGLVLCHAGNGAYWKVKPRVTYDVPVTGVIMGKGKHAGRMGALITPRGQVGTGFSDAQRENFARMEEQITGTDHILIEVECMGLTPAGKFRHARFLRVRWDK